MWRGFESQGDTEPSCSLCQVIDMSSASAAQSVFDSKYLMDEDVEDWIPNSNLCTKHKEVLVCYRRGIPTSLLEKINPDTGEPILEHTAEEQAQVQRLRAKAWQEKNDGGLARARFAWKT